jgi:hypothetical protein
MKIQTISICSLNHKAVWQLTSSLLPEFVKADEYLVYVPENEVEEFKKFTNPAITICSQSDLGNAYSEELLLKISSANNQIRFGWYLQQFFKIEALLTSTADYVVIWDSDCVPVSPIPVIDELGCPIFMSSAGEYNQPYFDSIKRLLGLDRAQDFSFVIPGFPIPKTWLREFEQLILERHEGKSWSEAIMDTTDFALFSGFSETETLGTFVANAYPDEWSTFLGNWERRGQKRFGYARKFTPERIKQIGQAAKLDIISFENWDTRGFRLLLKRIREKCKLI